MPNEFISVECRNRAAICAQAGIISRRRLKGVPFARGYRDLSERPHLLRVGMFHILCENSSGALCHTSTPPGTPDKGAKSTSIGPEKRGDQLLGRGSALCPKPFQARQTALCDSKIQLALRGPSSKDQSQVFEVTQIRIGPANRADSDFVRKRGNIHPRSIFQNFQRALFR